MKLFRISLLIFMATLMAIFFIATPTYASIPGPDSPPTIQSINVYRNLRETGDRLFVVYANIPYASTPAIPVTQAFIWQLIDIDGTTELGSTVGYAFTAKGYGYNVYSLYFSASDNLSWGQQYTLRLTGNPAIFDDPPIYNFTINSSNYTLLTEGADNKAELAAKILNLAADLDNKWARPTDYSLLIQIEAGTILSIYGEAFFRGAIHGLQALAPAAFRVSIEDVNAPDRPWNLEYTENLTAQWNGTWIDTAKQAGKALFNTDFDLLSIILLFGMCLGLVIGNVMLTGDAWNGLIDAIFVLIVGGKLGMYGLGFLGLVAALCIIYIGAKIWFGGLVK